MPKIRTTYQYFGNKSKVVDVIWSRFGKVDSFIDPFFGSGAALFRRPGNPSGFGLEVVNDKDCFVCNFWRASKYDSERLAELLDWPTNEADLESRHRWLCGERRDLNQKILADPKFFDTQIAAWWCWGLCCWVGSGWCKSKGRRQIPQLHHTQGIRRMSAEEIRKHIALVSKRLQNVGVCCGDWKRVLGHSSTTMNGVSGILLDPPYSQLADCAEVYCPDCSDNDHTTIDVRNWAVSRGEDPRFRIALCGYVKEQDTKIPASWTRWRWKTRGGWANTAKGDNSKALANSKQECIWFSPHCLKSTLMDFLPG